MWLAADANFGTDTGTFKREDENENKSLSAVKSYISVETKTSNM